MIKIETKQKFVELLALGLENLDVSLSAEQTELLFEHFSILEKWRNVHNLTTIGTLESAVYNHYIDCLKGLSFLKPTEEVVDFGSGAGFPGVVAAVLWPHVRVVLVEASRKKCSFLHIAVSEMGLRNVEIVQQRVETINEVGFAISRATFSPPFLKVAANALKHEGELALWVGDLAHADLAKRLDECGLRLQNEFVYQWQGIGPRRILLLKRIDRHVPRGTLG